MNIVFYSFCFINGYKCGKGCERIPCEMRFDLEAPWRIWFSSPSRKFWLSFGRWHDGKKAISLHADRLNKMQRRRAHTLHAWQTDISTQYQPRPFDILHSSAREKSPSTYPATDQNAYHEFLLTMINFILVISYFSYKINFSDNLFTWVK